MLIEARDAIFGYGDRPIVRADELHVDAGKANRAGAVDAAGGQGAVRYQPVDGLWRHAKHGGGFASGQPDLRLTAVMPGSLFAHAARVRRGARRPSGMTRTRHRSAPASVALAAAKNGAASAVTVIGSDSVAFTLGGSRSS